MLNLQEAVQAAKSYLPQMDPDDPYRDLLVEEVELNEDGDWEITLGFYRKRDITIFGGSFGGTDPIAKENRAYKTLLVDRETGEVKKIKIREVSL